MTLFDPAGGWRAEPNKSARKHSRGQISAAAVSSDPVRASNRQRFLDPPFLALIALTFATIWLLLNAQSIRAETINWTNIPRQGGGSGWDDSGPSATPPSMAAQTFVGVGGTSVNMTVRYSGNMWDNNSVPKIYGAAAPVPVERFRDALRWTNNRSDTGGAAATATGPSMTVIEFSSPILLDDFTITSLSRLLTVGGTNQIFRYEWMDIAAYDDSGIYIIPDAAARSTYAVPSGAIEVRANSPLIEVLTGRYRVRGTSQQCASVDCGYDRLSLTYSTTPIKRIELIHFVTLGEDASDPRATGSTSVALEPVTFSLPAVEFDWGDAPDIASGTGAGNYNTLESNNGPRHIIVDGMTIGTVIDDEADGQPSAAADGDDTNPPAAADDEDGVVVADLSLVEGSGATVRVNVTNLGRQDGVLYGWIDFDGDGAFESGERAQAAVPATVANQTITLDFGNVPTGSAANTFARFRLSTDSRAVEPTGPADDGEVEDYPVSIAGFYDWADAPDSGPGNGSSNYNTLASDNGPRHQLVDGLRLGAIVDDEADGQQSANADGDDLNPPTADDEDGVTTANLSLVEGNPTTIRVDATNPTLSAAILYGWIDFNGNGLFEASENAQVIVPASTNNQTFTLNFGPTPTNGVPSTFARFRLSSDARASSPVGEASNGEVEDYLVTIEVAPPPMDWGDAPDTADGAGSGNYFTLFSNDGPRHIIVDELRLGTLIDAEDDGQPTSVANGDDTSPIGQPDDEDGVMTEDLLLHPGHPATVRVRATNLSGGAAILYGWIDFDGDGLFEASEQAATAVTSGANDQQFTLDFGTTPMDSVNATVARFRLSSDIAASAPTGLAENGEVEDYVIEVAALYDWGDAPDTGLGTGIGNYNTLANDSGPSHQIIAGIFMGGIVDTEDDGQPSVSASGDDINPPGGRDDEDGVDASDLSLTGGQMTEVRVAVTNQSSATAALFGWIDFNTNGVFELNERSSISVPSGANGNIVELNFGFAPSPNAVLQTYARFRLSTDGAAASTPVARATDGEVEDHPVLISPEPSAVELSQFTASYAEDRVEVRWETSNELDTSGFNIYRSTLPSIENAVQINAELIASQGGQGGTYSLDDDAVVEGLTYYYWLIEVETDAGSIPYGPTAVSVRAAESQYSIFLPTVNGTSR